MKIYILKSRYSGDQFRTDLYAFVDHGTLVQYAENLIIGDKKEQYFYDLPSQAWIHKEGGVNYSWEEMDLIGMEHFIYNPNPK